MTGFDYDVLIIGSGFGGSVAALRAAEKGYRVGVMESGRRWRDKDIPKTQWDLPGFLWFPSAELYGIQRIEYLDDVLVLCGAGVGGGSHVYANTLYVPPGKFFDAPEWAGITDWADERPVYRPGEPDARRRSLPLHAHRRGPVHAPGRGRDGPRGNVQQGSGGCLLRPPGRRGGRPVLRRRRTAAHRMYFVRQLQQRLRAQRQEQADDELPVPGRETRRRGPRPARGVRAHTARQGRVRGPNASSRLGSARGASPSPYLDGRSGHRGRARLRLGQAPAPHAAHRPPDGPVEPARTASADELRTASGGHQDPWTVGEGSGEDPAHAGVSVDYLWRLA